MQLTGKQIVDQGIVKGYSEEAVQQQGVDVRLSSIMELYDSGYVPKTGKTTLCKTRPINPVNTGSTEFFVLLPGYYEVNLMEACSVPNNGTLHFKTRSGLVRNGAIVHSGQFDAGFETEKMGCFLQVNRPIRIEVGARIAQAIVFESESVNDEDLYNGQYQGDKQRVEEPTTTEEPVETTTEEPTTKKSRKKQ